METLMNDMPPSRRPADLLIRLASDSEALPRLFSAHESCTIGRGYRNDLVINDEYADAEAVRLSRTADGLFWQLELINNSVNVRLNERPLEAGACYRLQHDDELTLGKTTLLLIDPDQPVPAARALRFNRWTEGKLGILFTLVSLLLVLGAFRGLDWLLVEPTGSWRETVVFIAAGAIASTAWASVWALAGKLFRQQSAFFDHLLTLTWVMAITLPLEFIPSWLGFTTNEPMTSRISDAVATLIVLFLLLSRHLALATRLQRPRLVGAIATLVMGGVMLISELNSVESRQYWPQYTHDLAPASWYFGPRQSADDYLLDLGQLLDEMPAAADEPLPDDAESEALLDLLNEE